MLHHEQMISGEEMDSLITLSIMTGVMASYTVNGLCVS